MLGLFSGLVSVQSKLESGRVIASKKSCSTLPWGSEDRGLNSGTSRKPLIPDCHEIIQEDF